jgi:short-subunit dehydrogenase
MVRQLKDQVIVITGASSGMGRATAIKCAEAGAHVVLAARDRTALDEVVSQIEQNGGRAFAVETNVSDWLQVEQLANQTQVAFGRIDTWINDAGTSVYGNINDITPEEAEQITAVNLLGTIYGVKAVLPYMQRQGYGTIINVGSVLSEFPVPLQSVYAATKHGVKGFTESLRLELMSQPTDIRVTLVMPSAINTPFFSHARSHMGVRPQPFPPAYNVELAADVIVHAIKTRPRAVYVGGAALLFTRLYKLSPALTDRLMLLGNMAIKLQKTNTPDHGQDSLFEPMQGTHDTEGEFAHLTKPSIYTRLARINPLIWIGAAGVLFSVMLSRRH